MLRSIACGACCLAVSAAPLVAVADGYPGADGTPPSGVIPSPITDHFDLEVSYLYAAAHTQIRLDPTGEPYGGTPLSGENDLGLTRRNPTGLLELTFRMRERNRMRVDYFELDRAGNVVLGRTVIFGIEIFDAGNAVQTSLDWKMMGFTYTHAFIQTDRFELGAGLGVHLLDADVTGTDPTLIESHETARVGAVPTLALDTMWRISRRFAFTAHGQYARATIDHVSGSFGEYHGDFQYRWQPSFALGLGYFDMRASISGVTGSTPGRVVLSAQGPELFARVSF